MDITDHCHGCNGTGTRIIQPETGDPQTQDPCEYCEGSGRVLVYTFSDDKFDAIEDKVDSAITKCNDLMDKCNDIIELLQAE